MARRPYTTRARLFRDSDEEVTLEWFPAKEPIEVLPFPTCINSTDWHSFPWERVGPGEVFGASRLYNGRKALGYLHGLTPCAPADDFRQGQHFDPDRPPTIYNQDQIPLCCVREFSPVTGIFWFSSAIWEVVPVAGSSCATAGPLTYGLVTNTVQAGAQVDYWYAAPIVAGHDYKFSLIAPPGVTDWGVFFETGVGCSFSQFIEFFLGSGNTDWTFTPNPGDTTVYVHVFFTGTFGTSLFWKVEQL
jgi:hypothetical protein